jgi:hypothetical protein
MKRWMMRALVAGCVGAVGCGGGNGPATQSLKGSNAQAGGDSGSGSGSGSDSGSGASSGSDEGSSPGGTGERSFNLRLQGVDAGDLASLLLRVKAVEVRANGTVLANTLMTSQMDLTVATNAFLLTSFKAPAGVEEVEIAVALDSATAVTSKGSFDVDLNCEVIRLEAKVKLLEVHHHGVIVLDLARSFGKVGTNMMLAPHLHLVY